MHMVWLLLFVCARVQQLLGWAMLMGGQSQCHHRSPSTGLGILDTMQMNCKPFIMIV
jgi:hypothetical protein